MGSVSAPVPVVYIVDDDNSFRTSVGRLVEASGWRSAGYASGAEFLARLPVAAPGCVVLDLEMPGLNGLELQARLAGQAPALPIVFLTGQGNIEASVRAIKAGADDFLEKSAPTTALLAAIQSAIARGQARAVEHERTVALQAMVASLTKRESVVFGLVVRGNRNKQIAYELGTSERTVKAHRRSIMEKLNARSLAEVVSIAERLGLLSEPPAA
jgi:FixJ family two-component response regulator